MIQQRLLKNAKLEKTLLDKLPEQFRNDFQKKFGNNNSYWQTISEARAIIVFNNLGIPVKEIDAKTIKDKNVDFLAVFDNEKIYTEVKGFVPEDYEIAKNGNILGADDKKIIRALDRAQPKFLNSSCNILIIADEDTIKLPLFMDPLVDLQKTPEIYLNSYDYIKTSAIMILGGLYDNQLFKFKIWYNANPQKSLSQSVMNIFNKEKANFIDV